MVHSLSKKRNFASTRTEHGWEYKVTRRTKSELAQMLTEHPEEEQAQLERREVVNGKKQRSVIQALHVERQQ